MVSLTTSTVASIAAATRSRMVAGKTVRAIRLSMVPCSVALTDNPPPMSVTMIPMFSVMRISLLCVMVVTILMVVYLWFEHVLVVVLNL